MCISFLYFPGIRAVALSGIVSYLSSSTFWKCHIPVCMYSVAVVRIFSFRHRQRRTGGNKTSDQWEGLQIHMWNFVHCGSFVRWWPPHRKTVGEVAGSVMQGSDSSRPDRLFDCLHSALFSPASAHHGGKQDSPSELELSAVALLRFW